MFDVDCAGTTYDQIRRGRRHERRVCHRQTGLIPTGLSCTVTERSTPDWELISVVPAGGVVAVRAP